MGSCFGKTKKSAPLLPSKAAYIAPPPPPPPLHRHATLEKGESFQRVMEMSAMSTTDLKQAKEEEPLRRVVVAINPIAELKDAKEGRKGGAAMPDNGSPPQTLATAVLKQQEKEEEEGKRRGTEKDGLLRISAIAGGLKQEDDKEEEEERKGKEKQELFCKSAIADIKQVEDERGGTEKCELFRTSAVADIKQVEDERGGTEKCELFRTSAVADIKQEEGERGGTEKCEFFRTPAVADIKQEEERGGTEKCELFWTSAVADIKQEEEEERGGTEKYELFWTSAIVDIKQEEEERGGTEKCESLQTLAIADIKKEEERGGMEKCELLQILTTDDNHQQKEEEEEERVGTEKHAELLRTLAMADLKQGQQKEKEEEEETEKGKSVAGRVEIAIMATANLEEAKEVGTEKEKQLRVVAMTHNHRKVEAKEEHPKAETEDGESSQKSAISAETQERSEEKPTLKEHEGRLGNFMENSEYFSENMFRSARFESAKERLPSAIHRRIPSMESLLLFDADESEASQQACSSLLVLQTLADLISKSNGRNFEEAEEEEEEEDNGCDWARQRNQKPEENEEARELMRENEWLHSGDFTFAANHSRSVKGKESAANQSSWRVNVNNPWRHSTEDDIVLEEIRSDDSMNEEEEEERTNAPPLHHHPDRPHPRHYHEHEHHHHLHEDADADVDDRQVLLPNLSLDDIILLLEKDELDQHLLSYLVSSKSSCHASDVASEASFEFKIGGGGSMGSTPQSTPSTPMLSAGSTPRKICQLNSMALTQDEISEIWGLFESRQTSNGSCSTSNVLPPTYC